MKNRMLAFALSLALCSSLFNATVFAAQPGEVPNGGFTASGASAAPATLGGAEAVQTVTAIDYINMTFKCPLSEVEDTLEYFKTQYDVIRCTLQDGSMENFPVAWDFSAFADGGLGMLSAVGTVLLPEGYAFAQGITGVLTLTLNVTEAEETPPLPDHVVLVQLDLSDIYQYGIFLPLGDTQAMEEAFAQRMELMDEVYACDADITYEAQLSLERLDTSDVDIFAPGLTSIRAYFQLSENQPDAYPEGFFQLGESVREISIPVYVAPSEGLSLLFCGTSKYALSFEFFKPTFPTEEPVSLYYIKSDTELHILSLPEADWQLFPKDIDWGFDLRREEMEQNIYYYFRAQAEGGYSNIIMLIDDGQTILSVDHGGNRDGSSDNTDGSEPPLTQPPPQPPEDGDGADNGGITPPEQGDESAGNNGGGGNPSTPETPTPPERPAPTPTPPATEDKPNVTPPPSRAESEPPAETVRPAVPSIAPNAPTPPPSAPAAKAVATFGAQDAKNYEKLEHDSRTISGARLAHLLLEYPDAVPFGWNGMSIALPSDFLRGLALEDGALFSLTMTRSGENAFTLCATVNGEPLDTLAESRMLVTISDESSPLSLWLDEVRTDTPVTCEQGYAVFTVSRTGSYRLEASEAEAAAPPSASETKPVTTLAAEKVALPPVTIQDFIPMLATAGILLLLCAAIWWKRWRNR